MALTVPVSHSARDLGRIVLGWSGGFPLLIFLSMPVGPWFLAAHYYSWSILLFAHFLFMLGGAGLFFGWRLTGRVLTSVGTVLAVAAALAALSIIHMISLEDPGSAATMAMRVFLYVVNGAYLAGNVYLAVALFKVRPGSSAA